MHSSLSSLRGPNYPKKVPFRPINRPTLPNFRLRLSFKKNSFTNQIKNSKIQKQKSRSKYKGDYFHIKKGSSISPTSLKQDQIRSKKRYKNLPDSSFISSHFKTRFKLEISQLAKRA